MGIDMPNACGGSTSEEVEKCLPFRLEILLTTL